ncbi:hypothetical protein [Actinocatenispora comari]|uniref:Uncharacterized protein n=1 Tax=Actinocatenispora comari TaxID=2807577 RepID=A0A8J4AH26_9ACTN|nr:hypothetical protein [Actinocatenispora comari]GIL29102.1 hypothetical protein NUM_43560 [Actinocatenispora comari]
MTDTESTAAASAASCDCGCPIHHGKPRTVWNDSQCRCALMCATQPTTVVAREWDCVVFLDPADQHMVLSAHLLPMTRIDWSSCAPIAGGDGYHAKEILHPLLASIITYLNTALPVLNL